MSRNFPPKYTDCGTRKRMCLSVKQISHDDQKVIVSEIIDIITLSFVPHWRGQKCELVFCDFLLVGILI